MIKGIDVSVHQGTIEWRVARLDGVEFAMIKATQGRGETPATEQLQVFTDSRFAYNIEHAHAAGIKVGVYHYFTARTAEEVDREVEYFLSVIRPYRGMIDLWAAVVVESEPHLVGLAPSAPTALVKRFMRKVKAAGFRPMLYTNLNYLWYRYTKNAFAAEDVWLAQWGASSPAVDCKIFQPGKGRVSGITTEVDLDYGYFDLPEAEPERYAVNDKYTIKAGDVYIYSNGRTSPVPDTLIDTEYTISQVREGKILLREIVSWVKV